jgi:hypothetical protein
MLELNNSFLLIALIIIAVICIYLLYSNLTKSGETASLKSGITALIQQNKKRDEIINFLLERVENLEHNVTPAQVLPVAQTPVDVTNIVTVDDIDDVLLSAEQSIANTVSAAEVADILDSINTTEQVTHDTVEDNTVCTDIESPVQCNTTGTVRQAESEPVLTEVVHVENTIPTATTTDESSVSNPVSIHVSEFAELESEFDGLLTTENVTQHEAAEPVSGDLVSALLDADEESLAGDHEFDLTTVPKAKDKLNAQYTVKQLKALSRQLKLKSKGNKTDLINRIYEKLN